MQMQAMSREIANLNQQLNARTVELHHMKKEFKNVQNELKNVKNHLSRSKMIISIFNVNTRHCDDVVITRSEKRERWNDNRTEKKIAPSRDSNHAPPTIRADVLAN